jgi:hypothetical protein
MSWSINIAGTKAGVRRQLQALAGTIDPSQLDTVRNFVTEAIGRLPETATGVHVRARGNREEGVFDIVISVQPISLALDEATPRT